MMKKKPYASRKKTLYRQTDELTEWLTVVECYGKMKAGKPNINKKETQCFFFVVQPAHTYTAK